MYEILVLHWTGNIYIFMWAFKYNLDVQRKKLIFLLQEILS